MKRSIVVKLFLFFTSVVFCQNNDWKQMSVTKFQMQNLETGSWNEIMFTNPGKYIKMKNDKDLHIDDLDILSFLGGQAGIYTAMEFNDGVKSHTDQEMTSRYDGNFVLFDNSHSRAKSDKGALFIFYGRDNKIGGIEIQSYLCRCKVRIFLADYQEGLKILN